MPRYPWLTVSAAGLLLGAVVATPAIAQDPAEEPVLRDLGPAAVGTAVNGAELVGDSMYLVSRSAVPSTLSTLDLEARTVTDVTTIPTGIEGWAATAVNDGRDLYFGMHTPADFYHFDTVAGTLDPDPVATFTDELLVMDQAVAPDDTIYIAGMAKETSGGVYSFLPSTGEVEPLGTPVPGQRYVRSIAADDQRVYAGMGPAASIEYRDRTGGEWQTIDIPELAGESFVYDVALADGYLTFGTEPSGLFGVVDVETWDVTITEVPNGRTVDSIVAAGTTAYFTVRPEGKLYSYDLTTGDLTELAMPSPGAEHRKLFVADGKVIGVGGAGEVWQYSIADGSVDVLSSVESGMPRTPERGAQSLTVLGGDAYVGGHWGIQRHDGTSGESSRFAIPGETKTMVGIRGILYASIYPASQVWTYNPESGDTEQLAQIRDDQMRPRSSHYNLATDSLLVGTREVYGNVGGAVLTVDPGSGDLTTARDLSVDQSPVSITSIGSTAFVGHEIHGEVHDPTTTDAHLVSWDIPTQEKGWDVVPVPGAPAITGLTAVTTSSGPVVYGLTENGWLFTVDPSSGEVIDALEAGTRATDLFSSGSGVYGLINGGVFRISDDPADLSIELVNEGAFTHIAADDTDDHRIYAVGIRTVDDVSQARLFELYLPGGDSDSDDDSDTSADAGDDGGSDGTADSEAGADSGASAGTDTEADSDTSGSADSDDESATGADSDDGAGSNAGDGSEAAAGSDTGANSGSGAGVGTGTTEADQDGGTTQPGGLPSTGGTSPTPWLIGMGVLTLAGAGLILLRRHVPA